MRSSVALVVLLFACSALAIPGVGISNFLRSHKRDTAAELAAKIEAANNKFRADNADLYAVFRNADYTPDAETASLSKRDHDDNGHGNGNDNGHGNNDNNNGHDNGHGNNGHSIVPYVPESGASSTFFFVGLFGLGRSCYHFIVPGPRDATVQHIGCVDFITASDPSTGNMIQVDPFAGEVMTPQDYRIQFVNQTSGLPVCTKKAGQGYPYMQAAHAMTTVREAPGEKAEVFQKTVYYTDNRNRTHSYVTDVYETFGTNIDPGRTFRGSMSFRYMIEVSTNRTLKYWFDQPTVFTKDPIGAEGTHFSQVSFVAATYDLTTRGSRALPFSYAPANIFQRLVTCYVNNTPALGFNPNTVDYDDGFEGMC